MREVQVNNLSVNSTTIYMNTNLFADEQIDQCKECKSLYAFKSGYRNWHRIPEVRYQHESPEMDPPLLLALLGNQI